MIRKQASTGYRVFNDATVSSDDAVDSVFGDEGEDWLLIDLDQDLAFDVTQGDIVTGL